MIRYASNLGWLAMVAMMSFAIYTDDPQIDLLINIIYGAIIILLAVVIPAAYAAICKATIENGFKYASKLVIGVVNLHVFYHTIRPAVTSLLMLLCGFYWLLLAFTLIQIMQYALRYKAVLFLHEHKNMVYKCR